MSISTALRLATLGIALALGAPAFAQTDDPALADPAAEPAQPAAKPKKAKDQSELEARVQQLERQMLDMQVVIGTLESMARQGGTESSDAGGAALGSDAEARLQALETQLQALASEVRSLGGRTVSSSGVAPTAAAPDAGDFSATTPDESTTGGTADAGGGDVTAPSADAIGTMLQNGDRGATASAGDPAVSHTAHDCTPWRSNCEMRSNVLSAAPPPAPFRTCSTIRGNRWPSQVGAAARGASAERVGLAGMSKTGGH